MFKTLRSIAAFSIVLAVLTTFTDASRLAEAASSPAIPPDVETVLKDILTAERRGQDGVAAIWDGNMYVQCRRTSGRPLRCEAAGALMQPSLAHTLVPQRVARIGGLGWQLDPSFGNYVQTFPVTMPVRELADKLLQVLKEGYDADLTDLDTHSAWIKSEPCPPRNGPSQNLAGMINDHPAMAAVAIRTCAYQPGPDDLPIEPIRTRAAMLDAYGTRAAAELQRLRANIDRKVFTVFDTG